MFRHTARALVLLFIGLSFAPMMQPLLAAAEQTPHEACMRMEHACHHASSDAGTSVRGQMQCQHDCCRGLTVRTSAAMPLNVRLHSGVAVVAAIESQSPSSYRFQQKISRPARAPPARIA
jgi:hypothetical protein